MSYARVERIEADDIPVIDIASLKYADDRQLGGIADELIRAAEGLGFFYVKGHGVSSNLLDQTYNLAQSFFLSADDIKDSVAVTGGHRGWLRIGEARMEGSKHFDLKESFIWGLDVPSDDGDVIAKDRLLAANRWPDAPTGMCKVFNQFFFAISKSHFAAKR